jgi:hypothetical protein
MPALPVHPTLRHPRTGRPLPAVGVLPSGKVLWPILGAEDPPKTDPPKADPPKQDPPPKSDPPKADLPKGDKGFPADTPVAEMTAEQQAAYWKDKARKHEDVVKDLKPKLADYDALKTKADEWDAFQHTADTEHEKALAAAREEAAKTAAEKARAEERARLIPVAVGAALRTQLAGRLEAKQVDALLDGIDHNRFLDDNGAVDADKVRDWVADVAPKKDPDLGQGRRGNNPPDGVAAGQAEYERRHPRAAAKT